MAEGYAIARQNGIPEERIVQSMFGKTFRGFLLCKEGGSEDATYHAFYADGEVEQINPPNGYPRPDPDTANRTRGLILPPSLIGAPQSPFTLPSKYTGLMRQVVQCEYIRGQETKFSYGWNKTHGLIEFPTPRMVGSSSGQEALNRAQRNYWVIEISQNGIFAAPVKMGQDCRTCALVTDYIPTNAQLEANPGWSTYVGDLSLAWAYSNRNEGGKVQQLMTPAEAAAIYAHGSPWAGTIGWAFNIYGDRAANVVAKQSAYGGNIQNTQLITLSFSVAFEGSSASIYMATATRANVTMTNHGFVDGDLAIISGAVQEAYNGGHLVINATANEFQFDVSGSPPSPATGDIKIANAKANATLSASVQYGGVGLVSFKPTSVLWVAIDSVNYVAVPPQFYGDFPGSGPIYVFYDGDEQVVTTWELGSTYTPRAYVTPYQAYNPADTNWAMNATGTHVHNTPTVSGSIAVVQHPDCEYEYANVIINASGSYTENHTTYHYGFNGPFDATINAYSRGFGTAHTYPVGGEIANLLTYNNTYSMCGGGYGRATILANSVQQVCRNDIDSGTESLSGSSFAFIPWHDRECIGFIKGTSFSKSFSREHWTATYRIKIIESAINIDFGDFTDYEMPYHGWGGDTSVVYEGSFSENVVTGDFHFRGTNGYSVTSGLPGSELLNSQISDLTIFNLSKQTAQSGLFYMGGGLAYADPNLVPANQISNVVQNIGVNAIAQPGFASISGKFVTCFVGLV